MVFLFFFITNHRFLLGRLHVLVILTTSNVLRLPLRPFRQRRPRRRHLHIERELNGTQAKIFRRLHIRVRQGANCRARRRHIRRYRLRLRRQTILLTRNRGHAIRRLRLILCRRLFRNGPRLLRGVRHLVERHNVHTLQIIGDHMRRIHLIKISGPRRRPIQFIRLLRRRLRILPIRRRGVRLLLVIRRLVGYRVPSRFVRLRNLIGNASPRFCGFIVLFRFRVLVGHCLLCIYVWVPIRGSPPLPTHEPRAQAAPNSDLPPTIPTG